MRTGITFHAHWPNYRMSRVSPQLAATAEDRGGRTSFCGPGTSKEDVGNAVSGTTSEGRGHEWTCTVVSGRSTSSGLKTPIHGRQSLDNSWTELHQLADTRARHGSSVCGSVLGRPCEHALQNSFLQPMAELAIPPMAALNPNGVRMM